MNKPFQADVRIMGLHTISLLNFFNKEHNQRYHHLRKSVNLNAPTISLSEGITKRMTMHSYNKPFLEFRDHLNVSIIMKQIQIEL